MKSLSSLTPKMPSGLGARLEPLLAAAAARWSALSAREQRLLTAAVGLLLLAVLWLVAVQPALRTVREAPAQRERLQAQFALMQAQAVQAVQLKAAAGLAASQAPGGTPEAAAPSEAALKPITDALGASAKATIQGRRAEIVFDGIAGEQLRAALGTARLRAQTRLVEARLQPAEEGLKGRILLEWGAP